MKLLLLVALIMLSACANMKYKPTLEMPQASLEFNEQGIPLECFDENGVFDSNRGHDYLDCDNLENRTEFK